MTPRSVLLALCSLDRAGSVALLRAHALAAANAARLLVLRVVPSRHGASATARQELECWAARELPYPLDAGSCQVIAGDFVAEVAAAALTARAELVVLPATGWAGRAADELSRGARLPVLVARPARGGCVVGATSLAHAHLPVLRELANLQQRLETKAVVVHTVQGPSASAGDGLERLRTAAGEALAWAELVVVDDPSAPRAILKVARQHDSDLIVIGAGARSPTLFGRTVTEEVVARARRSVWVTPTVAAAA